MKYEIRARLEKKLVDGIALIRINWKTEAADMCEAISKARAYIDFAECDARASCSWMTVEEAEDA